MIIDNSFVNAFSLLFIGFNLFEIVLNHHVTYKKRTFCFLLFNSIWLTLQSKFFICFKKSFKKSFLKLKRPIA